MNVPQLKNKQGFTIIEVVLVLAIAALIFLMVFIALPALQRNQRDTQRKNDLGRFMSAIRSYQSNGRGSVPAASTAGITGTSGLVKKYLESGGDEFTDPEGSAYTFVYDVGTGPTTVGQIRYATSATCDNANAGDIKASTGSTRKVAASIGLEGGGAYCQNN
jgi:prepilin-type N-terminal cleavage/methylation domain-containing protein